MWKFAIIYGPFAGLISIVAIISGLKLSGGHGAGSSQWLGYLIMILALTLVYFGTKRYRDTVQGGVISFGKALLLGLAISAVAGATYVLVWETYLALTCYEFIGEYTGTLIEQKRAAGMSGEELAAEIEKAEKLNIQYGKVYFRLPATFAEIFPVGLLVSLVSAAILRTRGPARR